MLSWYCTGAARDKQKKNKCIKGVQCYRGIVLELRGIKNMHKECPMLSWYCTGAARDKQKKNTCIKGVQCYHGIVLEIRWINRRKIHA